MPASTDDPPALPLHSGQFDTDMIGNVAGDMTEKAREVWQVWSAVSTATCLGNVSRNEGGLSAVQMPGLNTIRELLPFGDFVLSGLGPSYLLISGLICAIFCRHLMMAQAN